MNYPDTNEILAEIFAERRRQIESEGWSTEHDDTHADGQLAEAASCYAIGQTPARTIARMLWPWELKWWKPKDHRTNLVRAGALIVAEIERLNRVTRATKKIEGVKP